MILPWHKASLVELLGQRRHLPHALLLRGPRGTGMLEFARAVAQSLLCESPDATGIACGSCPGCTWFNQGSHPDFRLLEPARPEESGDPEEGREKKASVHIEVGQVRDLVHFLNLSTHRGGARAIVIHPADALNVPAANALLKSLEEPPPRTCFLLVSHRWHHLLPTIRSRCRQVTMAAPDAASALAWVREQGAADPVLALAHAGGAPLLAVEFDSEYWSVRNVLLKCLETRDPEPLRAAEELRDTAPSVVLSVLQKWSHDLALSQAAGRVRYNPDRAEALARMAAVVDRVELSRFGRRMARLQRVVDHPLNARLFLEAMLLDCAGLLRGTGQAA